MFCANSACTQFISSISDEVMSRPSNSEKFFTFIAAPTAHSAMNRDTVSGSVSI